MELFWAFLRSLYQSWGSGLTGKHDKLIAYVIIISLNFLSILGVFLDWENYKDLCNTDYKYSIATGPPNQMALHMLMFFTLMATFMCIIECLNAWSLICNGGHMKIPVELEQIFMMLLCQIPQATINLAISMCRNNMLTNHQSASCFIGMINSAARLYVYGFIKERMFEYERNSLKSTLTLAKYVTASVIWIVLLLTQAFMWDQGRVANGQFLQDQSKFFLLNGVSISLVRLATHETHPPNQTFSYNALRTDLEHTQDVWLVKNVSHSILKDNTFVEYYKCKKEPMIFEPPICNIIDSTSKLKFKFKLFQNPEHFHIKPLGEIVYNYGIISVGANNTEHCTPATEDLKDSWHLRYYKFVEVKDEYVPAFLKVYKPWKKVCITPYLRYSSDIDVCGNT